MKGSLFDIEAVGPETEKITIFLDSVGEDLFEIVDNFGNDNATGQSPLMRKLRLKKPLDREAHSEYAFFIGVKDCDMSTARESKHQIRLYVGDENDNKPIFLKTPYFRSVFENSPSNDLYNISASDADIGTSGKFSFFFTDECKLDDCQFFDINAATGHVKLKTNATLDYEKRNHYNLGILAKDHGVPSLNSTTNLVIEVKDQSDQPPVFEKSSYRANIDENIAKDSIVIQTRAFDGDRGIKNPVIYSIVAGNHNYHFRIDNSSGKIYVNSSIDRDNGDDYFELTVEATEIPDNTTGDAVVFVTIRDLNDNKPTFPTEGFLYSTNIPENTPIGATIFFQMGAYDNDREARNAKFQYSMLCDNDGTFTIDPSIGRIALNKSVDYEMKKNYTILVIATETDSVEKYSSNQTVVVIITNINDNNPVFNQSQYNLSVNEGDVVGTNIGQIMASDNDAGYYGDVTYSLIGNGADMFLVDKENGTISVARSLDYESRTLVYIGLQAKDGGNKITEVTLIISIIDNNDNPPIFNPSTPTIAYIEENERHGFYFTVQATDADSGSNSDIRYYIINGNLLKNFTINNITGNITNSGIIDYETKSEFTLVVMARDQGIPPLNATKSIVIYVKDKNDNAPYFNQTFYNLSLVENVGIDFPLVQLHAFDKDSGLNAELVYTIVDGNNEKMFTISIDGLVLTRSSPNREKTSFYILNVSVSDSGVPKMFSYTTLIVQILDENDNTPEFSMIVDKIQIKEGPSTVNSTVVNNTAVDNDLGLNGTVKYTIADGNSEGKFHIDSHTGEISVAKELDFETVRLYSLKIVATDKGTPRMLSGEYQLVVELLDINDNSPRFGQPEYSFTVTENRPSGTHIVFLRAYDRDSEKNKLITYSFSYGNIGFALVINNETGEISTSRPLDREKVSQYFLTVKAIDHGKPSLQGRTNITINVLDVNDVIPNFLKSSYSASVPEDTTKGTSIDCIVQAMDTDDGPAGAVTYELESEGNIEDGNHVFSIGSITGEVKTAASLNFEKRRNFTVTVTACDNGVPRLCSNVTLYVTITDTDDNAPAFARDTWSAAVNENVSLGVNITQIIATDDDFELHHRKIYYFITEGNEDEVFGIGYENGSVYVANTKNLDREKKDKYEMTVVARTLNKFMNKTVQETIAKLTIVVLDYNDNAPVFRQNTYRKKIPESFELNEEILTVSADDADIEENERISYFIVDGNVDGIFIINKTTGVIAIGMKLDRETKHKHQLIVNAKDHGTPSLSSNVTVDVTVTDTNDQNPVLVIDNKILEILENATIGSIVTRVYATDADLSENAKIGYRIVSGNDDGVFEINNKTGIVFTVKTMDHESLQQYQIGVQAYDFGSPSLQSDIQVITINIRDVNDNRPFFFQKSVTLSVFENKAPGSFVGNLTALDLDPTDTIFYYIIGGNGANIFAIRETSGSITTTKLLDREQNSTFHIYVAVFNEKRSEEFISTSNDSSRSVMKNVQIVNIIIADENDNAPFFEYNSYKAGVSENAEYNSKITRITCIDKDIGNNSKLIYKVVDLHPAELLSVEKETGWILAGQQQYFASGVGRKYSFIYSCEDPSKIAKTNVTIFVLVDDQRVRLTLGINDTEFVRNNIDKIKRILDEATGLEFNIDNIQYHLQDNGRYDLSKTDIFMHAVDPKTNQVVDKRKALRRIDANYDKLITIFQKYKVHAVEPKQADIENKGFDTVLMASIVLSIVLLMLLLCFLCVISLMRRSHQRKLRAAKAKGVQKQSFSISTPGTNMHVNEGSNPIWLDLCDTWKTENDQNSNTFKIYESKALSMSTFLDDISDIPTVRTFDKPSVKGTVRDDGILDLEMEDDNEEGVTSI